MSDWIALLIAETVGVEFEFGGKERLAKEEDDADHGPKNKPKLGCGRHRHRARLALLKRQQLPLLRDLVAHAAGRALYDLQRVSVAASENVLLVSWGVLCLCPGWWCRTRKARETRAAQGTQPRPQRDSAGSQNEIFARSHCAASLCSIHR